MRKLFILPCLCLLFACTKQTADPVEKSSLPAEEVSARGGNGNTGGGGGGKPTKPPASTYSTYTIQQGSHYCDQSTIKSVRTSEMKFMVKFDQSAEYKTADPNNQADINKVWGFSEGIDNQKNSARIGWTWDITNNQLILWGYVHANSARYYEAITPVAIGADITCSIKVSGNNYVFTVDGISITMPRGPSTTSASGYQQYPYFGGDETAPHKITIQLKSL